MTIPQDRSYTKDHEWAKLEGNAIRVGITHYAQDALGDVVFVQLPEIGQVLVAGASFAEVESTKSVSDIYAPCSGTVSAINQALVGQPELVNSSPYDDGWIVMIEPQGTFEELDLMSGSDYSAMIEV